MSVIKTCTLLLRHGKLLTLITVNCKASVSGRSIGLTTSESFSRDCEGGWRGRGALIILRSFIDINFILSLIWEFFPPQQQLLFLLLQRW